MKPVTPVHNVLTEESGTRSSDSREILKIALNRISKDSNIIRDNSNSKRGNNK